MPVTRSAAGEVYDMGESVSTTEDDGRLSNIRRMQFYLRGRSPRILATPEEGQRLVQAFVNIRDAVTRGVIINMVSALADTGETATRG
jgi:hypothetical protein